MAWPTGEQVFVLGYHDGMAGDAPFDALVSLAVATHLAWEIAEDMAAAARRDRELAWSAALTYGAAQGADVTERLWRSVERARPEQVAPSPSGDLFQALVDEAAKAYLAVEEAKERERLASARLSTAFNAAIKAMPAGMSRSELQRRYEAARETIRAARDVAGH
jgi:hypothetical protein